MEKLIRVGVLLLGLLVIQTGAVQASSRIEFVEFKDAEVGDAARILATMTGANVAATREAGDERVSLMLQNIDLRNAVDMLSRVSGLWYRYNKAGNSYLIMTEDQYKGDIVIFRDDIIRSFTLRHQNVKTAALTIQSLFGERVRLSLQEENDDFSGLGFDKVEDATVVRDQSDSDDGEDEFGVKDVDRFSDDDQQQEEAGVEAIGGAALRNLGGREAVDADRAGELIGSKTPIFVTTNRLHNLLFVRTSDENAMAEIEQLVRESDRPTPQVLLEMKIVRIDVGDSYDQDFSLSFNDASNVSGATGELNLTTTNNEDGTTTTTGSRTTTLGSSALSTLERQLEQLRGNDVTTFGFNSLDGGFYEFFSKYVNLRVSLLEKNNQAEVVAKPLILASNNRPAKLFIGEEAVIATGLEADTEFSNANENGDRNSVTTQTLETERRKVGNTLVLLPSINADRTVTIDILQDSSTVNRGGLSFPVFDNATGEIRSFALDSVEEANIKTVVVAKDGYTIALGGMIQDTQKENQTAVPLLGDLPFLGELFRSESTEDVESQYVMLITPHILMNPSESAAKSKEIQEFDYDHYSEVADGSAASRRFSPLDYVELTQFAMRAARGQKQPAGLRVQAEPVSQAPLSELLAEDGLSVWPVTGWSRDGLYITSLQLHNRSGTEKTVDLRVLPGPWLASAVDEARLSPFGQGRDSTRLYLLTSQPFERAVRQFNQRGAQQ